LFGVGIRYVGETVAKKLAKHFKNIENIKNALYDQLIEADEIGEKIANSIQQFFLEEENVLLIERLKAKGLRFEMEEKVSLSSVLEGKTVVISGTFETFSRDELKELIERNGGKNGSSISSKTDYLVAGANMGPAKLKQATSLGITMLSEEEFIKMINS
jgi:DNA ligase (NAD+)